MVFWYEFNLWCNLYNGSDQTCKIYIQPKNKISMWHKVTHTGNCNKQWLKYTDFPDIAWETWWIFFKGNFLIRPTKPIELSHEWVKTSLKYQEPELYSIFLISQKTDPLKSPPDVQKLKEKQISTLLY